MKEEYNNCFTAWYEKFLKGETIENECQELFDKYHTCVEAAILKNKGIHANLEDVRKQAPFENGGKIEDN